MLTIIVTDCTTGKVTNVQPLDKYMPILEEFEGWCTSLTRLGGTHGRVTLWDTETNMSQGSREINVPRTDIRTATTDEIRTWVRDECGEEYRDNKKIVAIKKTRTAFGVERGFVQLGLRDAKEHVEAVFAELDQEKKKLAPCGSPNCTDMNCEY